MSAQQALATRLLLDGLTVGESARWHEGRLWFSHWGAREVVAVDRDGVSEVMAQVPRDVAFCIDWLHDGRLLITGEQQLWRREPDGSLVEHVDLRELSDYGWNEIVVDGRENIYLNNIDFDLMAGAEMRPGIIALARPDGSVRQVADGIQFPNGMAVTPDNSTLIVAESYASGLTAFDIDDDGSLSNRRVWAEFGAPADGISMDAEGAVWAASMTSCVRVAEGGEVLERIELDRACFACALGGDEGRTLHIMAAEWNGPERMFKGPRTGQVVTATAPAPAAGWP